LLQVCWKAVPSVAAEDQPRRFASPQKLGLPMGCEQSLQGQVVSAAATLEFEEIDKIEEIVRLAAPSEFHQKFELGQLLGSGAFGSVYSARWTAGGRDAAVKILDLRPKDLDGDYLHKKRQRAVAREVTILQALPASANLVGFYGNYVGEGLAYIVMEKCSMGLLAGLRRFPMLTETTLKPVLEDMLSGIAVCHVAGVVHRDVKCDNFLVSTVPGSTGFVVKLCDFGLACEVSRADADELTGICGTAPYMAPEMLCERSYGGKVDVWAMGVLAYVLLFGQWPYMPATMSSPAMKNAIRIGTPAPGFYTQGGLAQLSSPCATWVRSLLTRDPKRRPTAAQALRAGSFRGQWASADLTPTVRAAVRCGAFEVLGKAPVHRPDLHALLKQVNRKCHSVSEVSTRCSTSGIAHHTN